MSVPAMEVDSLSEGWNGFFGEIEDLTAQTIPRDFRDARIHRCWRFVKAG